MVSKRNEIHTALHILYCVL